MAASKLPRSAVMQYSAFAVFLCFVTMLLATRRGSAVEMMGVFRGEQLGSLAAERRQQSERQQQLGGFPVPPNSYQNPTVWQGDHVLSGGNKEWAEEDAVLHAYNMQRQRNNIIVEQTDRQRSQWDLMHESSYWDNEAHYDRYWDDWDDEDWNDRYRAMPTQLHQQERPVMIGAFAQHELHSRRKGV